MKRILDSLWQRRWCRMLGIGVLLCALLLLHPFARQSLFGPTIEGIPWCEWEEDFRRDVHNDGTPPSWFRKTLEDFGLIQRREFGMLRAFDSASILPLYLHLANDGDVLVRRRALTHLQRLCSLHEAEVVPALRERLQDPDHQCRLAAANGLWWSTKDPELKETVLPLLNSSDRDARAGAVSLAGQMAGVSPELFPMLASLAEDLDYVIRCQAIEGMMVFGERGIPVIHKGLRDPVLPVRVIAISVASRMPKHRDALVPLVLEFRNDPNPQVREAVADALHNMDAKRFPKQP